MPGSSQEADAETARETLKERWGAPDDVAEEVVFLVRASYITGEVLVVDGGQRLGPRTKA